MWSTAKRVGLGLVATCGIAGAGLFAAAPAQADTQLTCEMKGTWIEQHDDFVFQARYTAKNGPDTFDGSYFNATTKTTASVKGVAEKGTWAILLKYTDSLHKGQTRELVGTGMRDAGTNTILIKGTYLYKQDGRQIGTGTFAMLGKCK